MKQSDKKVEPDRRAFLKLAGVGTVAGGAALVSSSGPADAAEVEASSGRLYRETDHVRRVYDLARF